MNAVIDSGSVETVCGAEHIDKESVTETEASRKGMRYMAADGGYIKNIGEGQVDGRSTEGIPIRMKAQVGDKITKMLIAVRRAAEGGNIVLFNVDKESSKEVTGKEPRVRSTKKTGCTHT